MIRGGLIFVAALAAACGDDGDAARIDASPPIDAAPPADGALGVACRGADCAPNVACCRQILDDMSPPQAIHFCVPSEDECAGVTYTCDGPEDCRTDAGTGVCCSESERVYCMPPGTTCAFRACHTDGDCAAGTVCCDTPVGVIKACRTACGD